MPEREFNKLRWKEISIIPQSAMNALDPVYTIREQIAEAINTHTDKNSTKTNQRIDELMQLVGLKPERADDYPHEFSGGMRQRAMIAMALALNPSLIIADEPTTALDVIMQDQILDEILKLHKKFNITMLLITHDIAVVAQTCKRMGVMYAGKIMEIGTVEEIFASPSHPYTIGLLNAFPSVTRRGQELISIPGSPPSLLNPPEGCRFFARCPWAIKLCKKETPWKEVNHGHFSACHRLSEVDIFRQKARDYNVWQSVTVEKDTIPR